MSEPTGAPFRAQVIDDDPELMEQSYRLRYQVYCLERHFLPAEDYPDLREQDAFDQVSRHVGAVDPHGVLVATARLVLPSSAGLPLFHHCTLFPDETTIDEAGTVVLEVSRVSISRRFARRRHDPPNGLPEGDHQTRAPLTAPERRQRHGEPFLTLLRAIVYAAKREGATHLIGATDAALHRWLVHYGFPYRVIGPEVDYYGSIAPHLMSLAEFDQVVLAGQFEALKGFPVTLGSTEWPAPDDGARAVTSARSDRSGDQGSVAES